MPSSTIVESGAPFVPKEYAYNEAKEEIKK
jgi:hypothetical protein